MASLNKVILIGNCGRDPETRYLPNGDAVTNVSIATSETWKDKATGEKKEKSEWHRLTMYGKLGEIAGQYLKKGSSIYVEGRIQYREYEKDGIKRYSTDIIVDQMKMLGGKGGGGDRDDHEERQPQQQRPAQQQTSSKKQDDFDDDIPF
jgi:single-strand DNA-binding protein